MASGMTLTYIFTVSVLTLIYVFFFYYAIIKLACFFARSKTSLVCNKTPMFRVSVIIAAYNEENRIASRIENILAQEYPIEFLELIVASDGSKDKTAEIAGGYAGRGVIVLDFHENRGRSTVHNDCVKAASGDIMVFTDAETTFERNCIRNLVSRFSDAKTGCVVGNLVYLTSDTSISQSEGKYWQMEKKIREMESILGILSTATGACMGVRKNLWRTLGPIDDCDFVTPLDVILKDSRVVYSPEALAYDTPSQSLKREFLTRVRQTSKNLIGTFKRWGFKGWIRHPFISWGLLSHKILRWLTPFFMLSAFISNIFLLDEAPFYRITFFLQILFYANALLGYLGELLGKRIPVASTIFSFCIASAGMGIGVIKGILGKAPAAYKTEE
jgi:cellulose synthase/poly-beta-1,6-N-acetylglucosamine synthase-like glycosyltransferase